MTAEIWQARQRSLIHDLIRCADGETSFDFLSWDAIAPMYVNCAGYTNLELDYLQARPEWGRWENALAESPVGYLRSKYPSKGKWVSANLIHQAYHLARWEDFSGLRVRDLNRICEVGGGYGAMCRLACRLGFKETYVLHDLPAFLELQRHYTKSQGYGILACIENIDSLSAFATDWEGPSLFIGLWSVSEIPLDEREPLMEIAAGCESFLIAYQDDFYGIDNKAAMRTWAMSLGPEWRWECWPIEHLTEGAYYLMGVRE